ncbi:30S ribosomal protein S3 [Thermofilum pendens]|uniref:Small ribosomal subunit protein uS3 n=1 Tax=Thermofilum pendens (strain DSM 2475 / Hrk 5) TaxID=368408 RepID=RS3_THEPD|nr:30S ribosomal protein S3 [Thermofilum pendens]A1RXG6.2 RecName: Full=Small ribosomal subunit protein uS3; AltName: Full=30S ribosomal protein S3 [Thermofilum pendens Hrk 5]
MSTTARKVISQGLQYMMLNEYLQRQLVRANYVHAQFFKTPIGTKVIVYAGVPGLVIGRKGANIKAIAEVLEREFGIENPQIDVVEVPNQDLNAKIMAYRVARALVRGVRFRRAALVALNRIMAAGARGAEIVISGKLTSQRHRTEKFTRGYVPKSGEPGEELVDEAIVHVLLKLGMYGVKVRIMKPAKMPDTILIKGVTQVG